jgi:hypothetical protein
MNLLLKIAFFTILLFTNLIAFSQTTFDAEFRPRTELRAGFRKPLADTLNPALITFQRTRFNADYKGKILNVRISFQDARIWGNSDTKTNNSKVEIYEAWAEYLITSGLSAQFGRQPLKYDDQRLFSPSNWSNTGISHDVILLKYKSPSIQAHAGFGYNNSKDTLFDITYAYTAKQNYKTMSFLWLSKELSAGLNLSLIGIYEGFQNTKDYRIVYPRLTYGGNLVFARDSSAWGFTLTGYMQRGKNPGKTYGTGLAKLNAWFAGAKVCYKFSGLLAANIGLDYYSGSAADIDAGMSHTFNRLYGSTHSFNGSMEYFSSLPTTGLQDYYGGLTTKISPKLSADATVHLFCSDKKIVSNTKTLEKNLGTELDLTVNYTINKEIAIQGGYSRYFNSSSTKTYYKMATINTQAQQWCYLMLTVRPVFYKTNENSTKY